jgi:hypothetical protein
MNEVSLKNLTYRIPKGNIPWNKGRKNEYSLWPNGRTFTEQHKKNIGDAQRGKPRHGTPDSWKVSPEAKLKMSQSKKGKMMDSENPLWKGDNASYRAKHIWVETRLGKPRKCEECGSSDRKSRDYHWANISGNYQRLTADWRRLCAKCHGEFDAARRVKSVKI